MTGNPILSIPLDQVMRPQIALPLQQVLHLHTVGSFLRAWNNPRNHKSIEQLFDSPQQAQHAATVCATWVGLRAPTLTQAAPASDWWRNDDSLTTAPLRMD